MDIKVLRQIDYKGIPIYIRKIDKLFEYLIIFEGELYNEYFNIEPSKIREKSVLLKDYTDKQIENIIKMVYFTAYKTIDVLLEKK